MLFDMLCIVVEFAVVRVFRSDRCYQIKINIKIELLLPRRPISTYEYCGKASRFVPG